MRRSHIMALALILLVAPAAGQSSGSGESTPTTLYFHIWDPFNDFLINTQPFESEFFQIAGVNFPTNPYSEPVTGEWDFNTLYGYSTAGPVEYDFIENGRPRFHPERGIAADVEIDPAVQPVAYLYIDARGFFGGDEMPAVLHDMTFRITMRTGDDLGSDFDAGNVIMEGETTVTLIDGRVCASDIPNIGGPTATDWLIGCPATQVDPYDVSNDPYGPLPDEAPGGTPIIYPDNENVHELVIPLDLTSDRIPKADAYNIRLDWYQEANGAFAEDEFSENHLRLVLDDNHLPRLEMAVLNPVYIEFIHPQVAAGTLLIHTGVNSPWGTYDIDAENITLSVDGPLQPMNLQRVVAQNQHVHGLHDKAAEITYLWKFRDEAAPNGDYTITMQVPNQAGTAVAVGQAGFTIEGTAAFGVADTGEVVEPSALQEDSEASSSPGTIMLLAGLAAVGLVGRRP